MALNINFFGAPGVGKSTTASGLFHKMKMNNKKCEYVTEYAKDLVYSKDFYRLKDQIYILAKQHHPVFKLNDIVDYIINDGPFLLGLVYAQDNGHLPLKEFKQLVLETWKRYDHINFFVRRSPNHIYQEYGRNQTLEESLKLEQEIKEMLDDNNIFYFEITSDTPLEELCETISYYEIQKDK